MATDRELAVILKAKDEITATLKKITGTVGEFGKSAEKAQKPFDSLFSSLKAGIGIAAGLSVFDTVKGALSGAAGAAIDFEKSMSGIRAVSGATGDQMRQLTSLALDLGKQTSFSASEAAQGIEELLKGGVAIGDVFAAAGPTLNLAAAGGISLGQAAEIAANAMSQFGLAGSDVENVANKIAGAANASSLSVNDFAMSMSQVGAIARTAGVSFDSTAEAIALLGAAGIKGSDAGTSLKTMLLNLVPATAAQTAEFKRLGLITAEGANNFFDAQGKAKSLADISQVLQGSLKGMTDQQKLASLEILFGSDAMRAAAVLAREGSGGFDKMRESMGKVTAEAVALERLNNVAGDLEQLKGSAETLGIVLLSELAPAFRTLIQRATEFTNRFTGEAQTIIQTAHNISKEHGIGLVDAAIIAIENRLRETWGPAWADAFHNAKKALDDTKRVVDGAVAWLTEHRELVLTIAAAYATWAGAQGIGAVIGQLAALRVAIAGLALGPTAPMAALAALLVLLAGLQAQLIGIPLGDYFAIVAKNAKTFATTIGEALSTLPNTLKELGAQVVEQLAMYPRELAKIAEQLKPHAIAAGKAIVVGLIEGITGGKAGLLAAAFQLGAQAIGSIREAVNAQSPSREAMAIGQDIVDGLAQGLGAAMPQAFGPIERAWEEYREKQEDETLRHARRIQELEIDLGRTRGRERENVLHRIEEEEREHAERVESIQQDHGENVVRAEREQARERGEALRDFVLDFEKLSSDVAARAGEIGRKAGEALSGAIEDAGEAMEAARERAATAISELGSRLDESRELRARRDTFEAEEDLREKAFREKREDADIEYRWIRDKEKAQLRFQEDLARAQTDAEREEIGRRLTEETQAADRAYEEAKADLARRRQLEAEERTFRTEQERLRRQFEDMLEDEALARQRQRLLQERDLRITSIQDALAEKEQQIRDNEARERELLSQSYTDKVADLKEQFLGKVGPLTLEEFARILGGLEAITQKAVDAAAAITRIPSAPPPGGGAAPPAELGRNEAEQWWADRNFALNTGLSPDQAAAFADAASVAPPPGAPTTVDPNNYLPFQTGGVVPGPLGAARAAVVHGGEMVLTPAQQALSGGAQQVSYTLVLDGLPVARGLARYLPNETDRVLRLEVGA